MTPRNSTSDGSDSTGHPRVTPSRRTLLLAATAGVIALTGLVPENGVASSRSDGRAAAAGPVPDGTPLATPGVALPRPAPSPAVMVRHSTRPPFTAAVRSLDDFHRHEPQVRFAPRAVMLSLDDGPSHYWTPRFLDLLQRHHVRATFFMIGRQVPHDPGLVREVLARGHAVGNHTWTHDEQLGHRSIRRIRSEVDRTSDAIHTASGSLGYVPYLFRAPGGTWTPTLLHVLAEQQLVPVGWDVDPADWARPGTKAIEHTLRHTHRHDIVLCHDGGGDRSQTYHALKKMLPEWQHKGFTFAVLPRV